MPKKALIFGVTGQDGALLARLLLNKGYVVAGTSRDAQLSGFHNLRVLGIFDAVRVFSANPTDFRSALDVISRTRPQEVYNLAGQSSVGLSFEQPVETFNSIGIANLTLLEAIRFLGDKSVRYYNAGSGECFGNTPIPVTEEAPFHPRSPYAVAKAAAFWQVANYREAYGLYACSGILFNHESPLRPERFVTQKIVRAACRIASGSREKLVLGNMEIERDWGWAEEYVDAMWRILQQEHPEDLIIATGTFRKLKEFVAEVFKAFGLNWEEHVTQSESLLRPSDITQSRAQPAKAQKSLNWTAKSTYRDVARMLVAAELERLRQ
ncbi:MAG: GDP-mannose 4,6-dehydratase [Synergistaceae bacterium]|jgi:GDPmannose 4,6-dehydratase|nr:GDP-mannose 4,6-dehydratase [Synergistaceae bacterium]